jgi:hypothetical protein
MSKSFRTEGRREKRLKIAALLRFASEDAPEGGFGVFFGRPG